MNSSITAARAAGLLIAMLALGAVVAPDGAQARHGYSSYGYGPRAYGYRRSFEQYPDRLRFGTGSWWRAMTE